LADIGLRRDQINTLVAEQRKNKRTQAAAEAQNKRKTQTSGATLGGNGLAAQH
jgi:CBS domain containing-hemolysin-like protein